MKELYRPTNEEIEKASKEADWGWCVPVSTYLALLILQEEATIDGLADEMATTHKYGTEIQEIRDVFHKRGYFTTEKAFCKWDELLKARKEVKGVMFIEWFDDRDYKLHGMTTENTTPMDLEPDSHVTLVDEVTDQAITLIDTGFEKRVTLSREWFEERWGEKRKDAIPSKGWIMFIEPK